MATEENLMKEQLFRSMLVELSGRIDAHDLEGLVFMCVDIPRGKQDAIKNPHQLWKILIELNKIGAYNLLYLKELINTAIGDEEMLEIINRYENDVQNRLETQTSRRTCNKTMDTTSATTQPSRRTGVSSQDIANIAENTGRYWRTLARSLTLSEVDLDTAENRHPRDLRECTREVLKMWQLKNGGGRREVLLEALKNSGLCDIADNLENQ